MRQVIDSIEPSKTESSKASEADAASIETGTGPPTTHKSEVAFDALLAADVQITSTTVAYGQKLGGTEWSFSATHNTSAMVDLVDARVAVAPLPFNPRDSFGRA